MQVLNLFIIIGKIPTDCTGKFTPFKYKRAALWKTWPYILSEHCKDLFLSGPVRKINGPFMELVHQIFRSGLRV